MTTFTLTAGNLRRLLAPVVLAAADRHGPRELQTVRVQHFGDRVRATACNRYIAAWAEAEVEGEGTAEFLLHADDVKHLVTSSKPTARGRVQAETPVEFTTTANDDGDVSEISACVGEDFLNFRTGADQYPPTDRVLTRREWGRDEVPPGVFLDGKWLEIVAKGAAIVGEVPHVTLGEDPTKPVAVTIGADLLYLVMTRKPDTEGTTGADVLDAWVGRLS